MEILRRRMRTNISSSFGSAYNMDEAVSPTSSTSVPSSPGEDQCNKLRMYGKFFTTKLLQILVQSRTNDNHNQPCVGTKAPPTWFNLNIDELGEVSAQIKRSLSKYPPEFEAVSVDFYLYTADSDTLPLESWTFHINQDDSTCHDGKSEMSDLYHQLSTMLKSAMTASRMTPMHRYYVKKQSADTFVILYKIYSGHTTVELGGDDTKKTKVIGSFPTPVGAFTLTLNYRTRMEIEQKLAQSMVGITPEMIGDAAESFQNVNVGSFSSGNTPDFDANSPRSIDVISHFSVSPPYGQSPVNPTFLRGTPQNRSSRSRTCSLASEPESETSSTSPKEKMNTSHSMPTIQKNMPFANLLTLSYTGTLCPLRSVPEEEKLTENAEVSEEEVPMEASLQINTETRPDDTIKDLEHSQQTVVDDVMNETMKPPSNEKAESEDDDSFVKIPAFGSHDNDDSVGLNELITTCKLPLRIESFVEDDIHTVLSQLDGFSSKQGEFDQFLSEIHSQVDDNVDS